MQKHKHQGFTLIEILIVVAIIGMLVATVGPAIFRQFFGAQRDAAVTQLGTLNSALMTHRLDTFTYPKTLDGLEKNTTGKNTWNGPYAKKSLLIDPWGNPYQYRLPGRDGREYDLFSFGADGVEGGTGDNADVLGWE